MADSNNGSNNKQQVNNKIYYKNELIPFLFDQNLIFILWNILEQSHRDMHCSCFILKLGHAQHS